MIFFFNFFKTHHHWNQWNRLHSPASSSSPSSSYIEYFPLQKKKKKPQITNWELKMESNQESPLAPLIMALDLSPFIFFFFFKPNSLFNLFFVVVFFDRILCCVESELKLLTSLISSGRFFFCLSFFFVKSFLFSGDIVFLFSLDARLSAMRGGGVARVWDCFWTPTGLSLGTAFQGKGNSKWAHHLT